MGKSLLAGVDEGALGSLATATRPGQELASARDWSWTWLQMRPKVVGNHGADTTRGRDRDIYQSWVRARLTVGKGAGGPALAAAGRVDIAAGRHPLATLLPPAPRMLPLAAVATMVLVLVLRLWGGVLWGGVRWGGRVVLGHVGLAGIWGVSSTNGGRIARICMLLDIKKNLSLSKSSNFLSRSMVCGT